VLDAAAALDGASVVLAGTARVEDVAIGFRVEVPIRQTDETELGVPVIRKSTNEPFAHVVGLDEPGLFVRFDPAPWIRGVDFRPYVELAPGTAVEGTAEVRFDPESEAFRSVRNAVLSGSRTDFEWGYVPRAP
jgi:hypothetical protein